MIPGSAEFWQRVAHVVGELDQRNYYEVLGVPEDASVEVVQTAYHALIRMFHPDRYATESDGERQRALSRLFARINEAHRVLSRPPLRDAYQQARARGELRLSGEVQGSGRRRGETNAPRSEHARQLLARGKVLIGSGEAAAARAQLELAAQLEPGSQAIAHALAELAELDAKDPRRVRSGNTAAPPVRPPAPTPILVGPPPAPLRPPAPPPTPMRVRPPATVPPPIPEKRPPTVPPPLPPVEERRAADMASALFDDEAGEDVPPAPVVFSGARVHAAGTLAEEARRAHRAGRFTEARLGFETALRIQPEDQQLKVEYHLACAHQARRSGHEKEARRHFELVLRYDPRHAEAILALRESP